MVLFTDIGSVSAPCISREYLLQINALSPTVIQVYLKSSIVQLFFLKVFIYRDSYHELICGLPELPYFCIYKQLFKCSTYYSYNLSILHITIHPFLVRGIPAIVNFHCHFIYSSINLPLG